MDATESTVRSSAPAPRTERTARESRAATDARATAGLPTGQLRVALVGTCYWPIGGGMEVYARELARALAETGHEVDVVTRFAAEHPGDMERVHRGHEEGRSYRDGDVGVTVVAPSWSRQVLLAPTYRLHFRLPGVAERLMHAALRPSLERALAHADVVHYSGSGQELLGYAAYREAARRGVPFVVTPHTHAGVWGDGPIDIALYGRAQAVIALTEDERVRLARAGLSAEVLHVVPHGVSTRGGGDGTEFRRRYGLGDEPVVLFLGRKTPDKGFDLLLEAADHLWERVPDARIVLAGADGPSRSLPRAIGDPRVLELGRIDDVERENAFAACDVFCLPSEAEAFGLVILEAWGYGKPVVVSDIATLRERLAHGGGLAAPRSAVPLAGALADVLLDPVLRHRLGEEGSAQAAGATWMATAKTMSEIYRAVGAGRPS